MTSTTLMTTAEVAAVFGVTSKAVTRWANTGRLHPIRTPGATRRYLRAEIDAWLAGKPLTAGQLTALRMQLEVRS